MLKGSAYLADALAGCALNSVPWCSILCVVILALRRFGHTTPLTSLATPVSLRLWPIHALVCPADLRPSSYTAGQPAVCSSSQTNGLTCLSFARAPAICRFCEIVMRLLERVDGVVSMDFKIVLVKPPLVRKASPPRLRHSAPFARPSAFIILSLLLWASPVTAAGSSMPDFFNRTPSTAAAATAGAVLAAAASARATADAPPLVAAASPSPDAAAAVALTTIDGRLPDALRAGATRSTFLIDREDRL